MSFVNDMECDGIVPWTNQVSNTINDQISYLQTSWNCVVGDTSLMF